MAIPKGLSRRDFIATGAAAVLAPVLQGCLGPDENGGNAFLASRPGTPSRTPQSGATPLDLASGRDGVLYVPANYEPDTGAPLVVALHGAGGRGADFAPFYPAAEERGFILLAPDSRDRTWETISGTFGRDVAFIDRALAHTFDRCRVTPDRLALLGFSDGASYALSLGVGNGDLFSHLIAFSPGYFWPPSDRRGRPPVFVSHGTRDGILPVSRSRDVIVPQLDQEGHMVEYREFVGGHTVPAEISTAAWDWFLR